MDITKLLKLFVPPILILVKNKIVGGYEARKTFMSTISRIGKNDEVLIVIGNGPSLSESMEKYIRHVLKHDCIVVNHICKTDYYEQIKPRFYLLADPAFFGDIESYNDYIKNKIEDFIESFVLKTTWDINLIVPSNAIGCSFIERIKTNSFIHVFYYNNKCSLIRGNLTKYEMWDSNLIPPPDQTCLNTCVWLGIFLRYKRIFLIGADTSWIEQLHVDQETNEVYMIDTHFYGKEKVPIYADVEGKIPQKLHNELISISKALSNYWDLKSYADYAGVQIYNASKYSLIDAYERKKEIE